MKKWNIRYWILRPKVIGPMYKIITAKNVADAIDQIYALHSQNEVLDICSIKSKE